MDTKISLIIPYYNHPNFLKFQIDLWNSYSEKVKQNIEIILVDDCSKIKITDVPNLPEFPKNLSIYRILKDILWNEKGARNLGALQAKSDWLLHTDFDHWFDNNNLEKIIDYSKKGKEIYRFNRFLDGSLIHQHKESHIVLRKNYFEIGGFDEDFSGYWGSGPYNLYFNSLKKLGCKDVNLDIIINSASRKDCKDCQCSIERIRLKNEGKIQREKLNNKKTSSMIRFDWEKIL